MADIKQMFHPFSVTSEHRDLLRFFWYKDSDPDGELTEHCVKVHVIGNTSSPAALTASERSPKLENKSLTWTHNDFYMDDGL